MSYRASYCAFLTLAIASIPAFGQITVSLTPNLSPPQMVGTPIVFTAAASGGSGNYDYQFTANLTSTPVQIKQDFNTLNQFPWVPSLKEGTYTIGVVARDLANKNSRGYMTMAFTVTPALNAGAQAVHPTTNTLVVLFSAPPCPAGQNERVVFLKAHQTAIKSETNSQPCDNITSMNYYVAGMYPNTAYNMFWETLDKSGNKVATGQPMQITTGAIPPNISLPSPIFTAADSPNQTDPDQTFPIIFQDFTWGGFGTLYNVAATDLAGNYLWYTPQILDAIGRTETGGKIFAIQTPPMIPGNPQPYLQTMIEVDLVGNQLLNTNAEILSEQLVAKGKHPITSFSHELRRLPNGDLLTIGAEERLIANSNQCGSTNGVPNTCDVLGDEIIVLNSNMQYKWSWDGFDNGAYTDSTGTHQLVDTKAVLGEVCVPNGPGCPAFFLAPSANDWTHSNATTLTADGNITLSIRHLDWTIKVNYANGAGDGHIMWRMGPNGDFTLTQIGTTGSTMDLPGYPWFSHQHDAQFALNDQIIDGVQIFAVYDDGNTRIANFDHNGHSRGQIYAVNEPALQANLNVNADLLVYCFALGVAQILPNGNYFFDSGVVAPSKSSPSYVQESETDPLGNLIFILQVANGTATSHALAYRAFRMPNMYFETP